MRCSIIRNSRIAGRSLEHRRKWLRIVTTDCVILELGDALCHPRDREDFVALLESLGRDSRIQIVPLTPELLDRGIQRFRDRLDKGWSLTDCISFVVMEDEGIRDVLTGDRHFEQAGFYTLLAETSSLSIVGDGLHYFFDLDAHFFQLGVGGVAGGPDRFAETDVASREGQGDLQAVPAFKADFPMGESGYWNYGASGQFGQLNDPVLYFIGGASVTIGRDGNAVIAFEPARSFQQRLRPRGGCSNRG